MINLSDIHFSYNESTEFRIEIPKFSLGAGTSAALVGPSGCGKTTFLQIIAGIISPQKGEIHIGEKELSSLSKKETANYRLQNIGLIFQEFELLEHLCVKDNIMLPFFLGLDISLREKIEVRALELTKKLKIDRYLAKYPSALSGGERQRVAICRALAFHPKLLLADEPTGNLDPKNKRLILDEMLEIAREKKQTVIVATHDYDLLDSFDTVIKFNELNAQSLAK